MPMNFVGRFAGRSAVITGGASGIGLAVAQRIVDEGGRVSVWDRDPAQIEQAKAIAPGLHGIAIDVADAAGVEGAAARTIEALGGVDILVTSAAITGPNMATWAYSVEDWQKVIDININGVFYCNKALVPHMLERNYGRIVNIASVAGKDGNPNAAAYSAAKAGVIALTKSLGKELAKTKVASTASRRPPCKTEIFDQMNQEHIDFMLSKIPMARFRPGRRSGGDDRLDRLGRLLVHDRRRLRRFRRARYLLSPAETSPHWSMRLQFRVTRQRSELDRLIVADV